MPLWVIISYCIVSVLCIFSIVKLLGSGKKPYAKAAMSIYVFFTVVFLAIWIFNITVPSYAILLAMLTILGSCFFGHYLGGYTKSRTFDRYLHGFGSFSLSLFTYCILNDFVKTGGSLLFRATFIFLLGNTLGIFFELLEMAHDMRKPQDPKSQKGLRDTNMDILFNLMGSILAAVFAYFWLLK